MATAPGYEDFASGAPARDPAPVAGPRDASTIFGRYHTRNGKLYHTRINEYLADLRVGSAIITPGTYTNCQLKRYPGTNHSALQSTSGGSMPDPGLARREIV